MTKIQKIKAEIERLKKCSESAKKEWIDEGYNQNAFAEDCRIKSFDKLLAFIDSLPEEKPSEDLEKAASRLGFDYVDNIVHESPEHRWNDHDVEFGYRDGFIAGAEWQKEHMFTHHEANESLEEAVTHQIEDDGNVDDFVRRGIDDIALRYAELGAKWQKKKDRETIELAEEHAILAGRVQMKEEMMKDAVEGEAEELYNDGESQCTVGVGTYFKPGDEVYVIKKED